MANVTLNMESFISSSHASPKVSSKPTAELQGLSTLDPNAELQGLPWADEYIINNIYLCVMIVLSVTGIIGNTLVIGAVMVHKKLHVLSNAFIVNLAVADLCVAFFTNTFNIVGILTKGAYFYDKPVLCDILAGVCITSCTCSAYSVASIAVNRYVCICHRLHYPTIYNKRTLPVMIVGLWVMCSLIDLPTHFNWGGHSFDERAYFCGGDVSADYTYTIFFAVNISVIPFSILTYSYARILLYSRATKKALKNMQNQSDFPVGTVIKTTDMRLLKSIFTIWIIFGILWIPYAIVVFIDRDLIWPRWIYIFSIAMAHLSSSTNSVVYAVTNKNFREGYAQFLRLCFCCGRKATKGKDSWSSSGKNNSTGLSNISQTVPGYSSDVTLKK